MRIEDLRHSAWRFNERLRFLKERGQFLAEEYEPAVKEIIQRVQKEGDSAIIEYTKRFDGIELTPDTMEVPYEALEEAYDELEEDVKSALEIAHERIRRFHEKQLERSFFVEEEGIILGNKVLPLERVGIYVPGGKAAYPSTVLMNAVPAVVAGVEEVIMVSPKPNKYTLAAAFIAGVSKVYQIGGAQAIAGLAFGTQSLPKVDKIVGPGNIYVALAKKLLYGVVDIDMIAGPSEILIIADGSVDPKWTASDLLSQAEHDELAGAFMITTDEEYAKEVAHWVDKLLEDFPRKEIAQKSIERFGTIFLVEDLYQACEVANHIAPEHLEVLTEDPFSLLPYIKHAGAIFLGKYATEPLGDYVLGPNHTLPTGGTARFFSPLGVYHFLKRSSVIYLSREGFEKVAEPAENIAKAEGLYAHFYAVRVRRE
ncbi:MAG: histidinol dehydrogenase [Aquificota bacterium]|nr:histidinol dehydrogenase [Aquificaceae bacterium]MDM7266413.1 histidinol dehydrogenase [Aquificaceae bacterium]QWK12296.1 MAG: histidinol dehydrogenase [Aquificota bacterium]HAV40756.1 histidinol dehydrogenase [Aquificaceae bacterium]HCO38449.1 histidinol dehydrogenase [Aquificaceae bacterium]